MRGQVEALQISLARTYKTMKKQPSQCMDCRRWYVASGQIVNAPRTVGLVSHGLCADCYIERTAPLRPHTLAGWLSAPNTTGTQILAALR